MKKFGKILLVFFIFLILLLGLGFSFYHFNLFPQFNEIVNSVIFKDKIVKPLEVVEAEEVIEEIMVPKRKLPSITGFNSLYRSDFVSKSNKVENINEEYDLPNIDLVLEDNGYTLSSSNDYSWKTSFEYPIITSPVIYNNKIAFITADNFFILLDINSGEVSSTTPLEIICDLSVDLGPLQNKYGNFPFYEFTSLDGRGYTIFLDSDFQYDVKILEEEPKNLVTSLDFFAPSKEIKEDMIMNFASWGREIELNDFPRLKIFSGNDKKLIDNECINFYIYQPKQSGKYSIGLTNENGGFITDNAVVAVLKEDGSLVDVSLDYVANEPNVSVYLEKEIYYIVAYRIFVDDSSLKEVYLSSKKAL